MAAPGNGQVRGRAPPDSETRSVRFHHLPGQAGARRGNRARFRSDALVAGQTIIYLAYAAGGFGGMVPLRAWL